MYTTVAKRYFSSAAPKIITRQENGVTRIILSDEKTRNALSLDMLESLRTAIKSVNEDTRCVVLSATGKVFSAGHNLKELRSDDGIDHHRRVFQTANLFMQDIINMQVPVIAQVRGLAAAAGCQLVAMCDIVVAGRSATFSTPGANFGLFCSTPGIPLSRSVPRKIAAYMLLTGQPITADEALRAGLVSKVVNDEALDDETEKVVDDIKMKSKPIIALGKKFFYEQIEMNIVDALNAGCETMVQNLRLGDSQEGIRSFSEKRKPQWKHESKLEH